MSQKEDKMPKEEMKRHGFKESLKKKRLFYKNLNEEVIIFFDFRGLNFLEKDTFYYKILKELTHKDKTKYNSIIINEFFSVVKKIKKPFDFEQMGDCSICGKKCCIGYGEEYNHWLYCSEKCYKKSIKEEEEGKIKALFKSFEVRDNLKCAACGEKPDLNMEYYPYQNIVRHNHHTDYRKNKEKTISICPSCHTKITFHLDKYPELKKFKPIGSRKELLNKLEVEKKIRIEERLKKKKEKEIQKMSSSRGMGSRTEGKWIYSPPYKSTSPMLGAWLK